MSIRTKDQVYVHQHGFACGHVAIIHAGHTDYLHDGHLHTHTTITLTNTFLK
jgi:hypothetical protein